VTKTDTATIAVVQIASIYWLKASRRVTQITLVVVPFYWLWALAVYWDAGTWPDILGVQMLIAFSQPILFVPVLNFAFEKAARDPEGPFGGFVVPLLLTAVPIVFIVLAFDAFILLATVRGWVMSGQFLPAL
jgi:hypothetical protein